MIARRSRNPAKGTLDLPGGFVDFGENAETSAVREVKEETNLDIQSDQLKYLFSLPNSYEYSNFIVSTMDMFFEC